MITAVAVVSGCSSANGQASPPGGPATTASAEPNAGPASANADLCARVAQQMVGRNVGLRALVASTSWDAENASGAGTDELKITPISVVNCQPVNDQSVAGGGAAQYQVTDIDPEVHLYPHSDATMSTLRSNIQQAYDTNKNQTGLSYTGVRVSPPVEVPGGGVRTVASCGYDPRRSYLVVAGTFTDPGSGTVYDVLVKDALVSGSPEQPNT